MIRAYAENNGTVKSNTPAGQQRIRENMEGAGVTSQRRINAALRRGMQNANDVARVRR